MKNELMIFHPAKETKEERENRKIRAYAMIGKIHVCIAEHEDLWFVTHDNKLGEIKQLYGKITTDTHLLKLFKD